MQSFRFRFETNVFSLSFDPASPFRSLKTVLAEKLNVNADSIELLSGFPPRNVLVDNDVPVTSAISCNETIRIQLAKDANAPSTNNKKAVALTRTNRAANDSSSKDNTAAKAHVFGARIATLGNPMASTKKRKVTPKGDAGVGRQRAKKSIFKAGSTEGDISEHLLSAVSGTGDFSKRGRFLRSVFRRAVEKQYDSVMALARVDTVMLSGQYRWTESSTCRTLGGGGSESTAVQLTVTFHKGAGARSDHEETVDLLSTALIKAVLCVSLGDAEGEGKEILKPVNMAGCSPRIYWSLVHHITGGQGGVVNMEQFEACYREFFPSTLATSSGESETSSFDALGADWSWLTRRKYTLSEKAQDNLDTKNKMKDYKMKAKKVTEKRNDESKHVTAFSDLDNNTKSTISVAAATVPAVTVDNDPLLCLFDILMTPLSTLLSEKGVCEDVTRLDDEDLECINAILYHCPAADMSPKRKAVDPCATPSVESLSTWTVGNIAQLCPEDWLNAITTIKAPASVTSSAYSLEDQAEHCIVICQRFIVTQMWLNALQLDPVIAREVLDSDSSSVVYSTNKMDVRVHRLLEKVRGLWKPLMGNSLSPKHVSVWRHAPEVLYHQLVTDEVLSSSSISPSSSSAHCRNCLITKERVLFFCTLCFEFCRVCDWSGEYNDGEEEEEAMAES